MEVLFIILAILVTAFQIGFIIYTVREKPTKRDYFASRAPGVPEWFTPKIPKQPLHPGYMDHKFGKNSSHKYAHIYVGFYDDENHQWTKRASDDQFEFSHLKNKYIEIPDDDCSIVPLELKKEVSEHREKVEKWCKQHNAWERLRDEQTIVQWRYWYADLMIEHLK